MLDDKSALENIVVATPGLDRDPVAIGKLLLNTGHRHMCEGLKQIKTKHC